MSNWKLVPVEPTEEMITAGINAQGTADHLLDESAERSDMVGAFKAMLAAPTPPAQDEPYGYLYENDSGTPVFDYVRSEYCVSHGDTEVKLYTASRDSVLRKAAEDALEVLEYFSVDHRLSRYTMERVERAESHLRSAPEGK